MTTTTVTRQVLPGLRPEPLASYLAGLGLIRVLGEQADPAAAAAWTPDGLAITTTVPDIVAWLVDEYLPTPVLSPWNNGSGFGLKDKEPRRVLDTLSEHPSPRLTQFRDAIRLGEKVVGKARAEGWITDAATGGDKGRVVLEFRNHCPEGLLPWIDAAVVLAGDDAFFPPLLGTGGNDGRLDYSTNFHQRVLDVVGVPDRARPLACARAEDLLAGTETEQLATGAVGQFDPGGAGGPGSSRFGAAGSLVNPWGYVLLVEGALLFAASAVRRNQHYRVGEQRAAMPFTVYASPDGSASGAAGEESRGELWAPVWTAEFTLSEIKQLFSEARASWRGRPARRTADFYAATRTLGVARGVAEFTRYGLQRRNGLAFAAVPVDRISVREKTEVRLAAGVADWASMASGGDLSSAVGQAARGFEKAHLKYVRDGGALPLARMLAALTTLEQAVGRSGRAKENVYVRRPSQAGDFLKFLTGEVGSPELRIAVGLASCATLGGPDPARSMRQILLPVDPAGPADKNRNGSWRDASVVPGFGVRPLPQLLADVLVWRSRTAVNEPDQQVAFRGVPTFRSGIRVPTADLHRFAAGQLDDGTLDLWLRACLALDWHRTDHTWDVASTAIPVPTLGVLQPFAQGLGAGSDEPKLALRPDWAVRLAAGQVRGVHGEAVARLRLAGWEAAPFPPSGAGLDGTRIAAVLVPRCYGDISVLRMLARQINEPTASEEKS